MDECGSDTLVCLTIAEKIDENWAMYCYAYQVTLRCHACFINQTNTQQLEFTVVNMNLRAVLDGSKNRKFRSRASSSRTVVQQLSCSVSVVLFCAYLHARTRVSEGEFCWSIALATILWFSHSMALLIYGSPWNCCTHQSVLRVAVHVRPPFWDRMLLVRFRE